MTDNPRILNRIVPLAPNLALRVKPDPTLDKGRLDFSFANFGCRTRNVGRQELLEINRLIVRCAENTVFYRDDHPLIQPFIAKNRYYRIEPHTDELKSPTGTILFTTRRVVASAPLVEPTRASAG